MLPTTYTCKPTTCSHRWPTPSNPASPSDVRCAHTHTHTQPHTLATHPIHIHIHTDTHGRTFGHALRLYTATHTHPHIHTSTKTQSQLPPSLLPTDLTSHPSHHHQHTTSLALLPCHMVISVILIKLVCVKLVPHVLMKRD